MADERFRFLQQRESAYVPTGEIQVAEDSRTALRGLNPAGNTRWLALNLDDGTFESLEVRTRTETDIVVAADRAAAVQPNVRVL